MQHIHKLKDGVVGDSFAEVAKGILFRQGLQQADAAAALGFDRVRISQLCSPATNPSQKVMQEFAEALGFHLYLVAVPVDA